MYKLFLADLKMLLRNKQSLFWSLMFPLMFTFIFGSFFGKSTNSLGTAVVVNKGNTELAKSITSALETSEIFKIQTENSGETAIQLVKDGKAAVGLEIPEGFGEQGLDTPTKLKMYISPGNAQAEAAMSGILGAILTKVNFQIQNAKEIYQVETENTATKTFNYFDFILVGLIGMALMNSSIQSLAIAMSRYREDKILKRVTSTPLPAYKFIVAEVLSRLILNFVQISLILLVGVYGYHANLYGNIFLIYIVGLFGAVLFQAMGFAIASLSKTADAAEGMATAVTVPMMFLAGVFFPIDSLPGWIHSIVQYLPLAPLLRVMRGIALDGGGLFGKPNDLLLVLAWILVMLLIAGWKFRLKDE